MDSALESALCIGGVDVHLFSCVLCLSADSIQCHVGKEGSQTFGFGKALLGVFLSQLHFYIPRTLNTPHLLSWDLGAWLLDEIFLFFYCGARIAIFVHFGQLQHQAHVGLFQLYPTTLPSHICRHVEYLPDISCSC
jgi:hypothetical protein